MGNTKRIFDIKKIKHDYPMITIINRLGIQSKKKGRNIYILCPFHNDRHFGNCYIQRKNRIYCESCGHIADIIDLVCKVLPLSPYEACEWIVEGNKSFYYLEEEKQKDYQEVKKAFDFLDMEKLSIKNESVYGITNVFPYSQEAQGEVYVSSCGEKVLLKQELIESNPLYNLYKNDKSAFKFIIEQKANEKISIIENAIQYLSKEQNKNKEGYLAKQALKILLTEQMKEIVEIKSKYIS